MYYQYRQNNSRGYFKKPALNVFIEADSVEESDKLFQTVEGCYFDPYCRFDCNCCGSRWSTCYSEGLTEEQMRATIAADDGYAKRWLIDHDNVAAVYIKHKNKEAEIIQ